MRADIVASAVFPDYEVTVTRANAASFRTYRDQSPEDLRPAAGQHAIHMK
jgi:hypothetical protein